MMHPYPPALVLIRIRCKVSWVIILRKFVLEIQDSAPLRFYTRKRQNGCKLALSGDIALIRDVLQFIGVFVSFSIAYVSFRGVRHTESSSLLRLATAFFFLGFGFLAEGVVGLSQIAPVLPISATTIVVGGLLLETTGYFFLAFSHVVDVMLSKKMGTALLVL